MKPKADPARKEWARSLARVVRDLGRLRQLERDRADLFVQGRDLDPPVTFAEIAEIAGVTPAAVKQVVRREQSRPA